MWIIILYHIWSYTGEVANNLGTKLKIFDELAINICLKNKKKSGDCSLQNKRVATFLVKISMTINIETAAPS